jgi:peptide deformylase
LRQRARETKRDERGLLKLYKALDREMTALGGIGLAAPQIGDMRRCCIITVNTGSLFLQNPRIVWASPEMIVGEEGCLSFPNEVRRVERHAEVRVQFEGAHGSRVHLFSGLQAVCVQHEIDHLDGITFRERGR